MYIICYVVNVMIMGLFCWVLNYYYFLMCLVFLTMFFILFRDFLCSVDFLFLSCQIVLPSVLLAFSSHLHSICSSVQVFVTNLSSQPTRLQSLQVIVRSQSLQPGFLSPVFFYFLVLILFCFFVSVIIFCNIYLLLTKKYILIQLKLSATPTNLHF